MSAVAMSFADSSGTGSGSCCPGVDLGSAKTSRLVNVIIFIHLSIQITFEVSYCSYILEVFFWASFGVEFLRGLLNLSLFCSPPSG